MSHCTEIEEGLQKPSPVAAGWVLAPSPAPMVPAEEPAQLCPSSSQLEILLCSYQKHLQALAQSTDFGPNFAESKHSGSEWTLAEAEPGVKVSGTEGVRGVESWGAGVTVLGDTGEGLKGLKDGILEEIK